MSSEVPHAPAVVDGLTEALVVHYCNCVRLATLMLLSPHGDLPPEAPA